MFHQHQWHWWDFVLSSAAAEKSGRDSPLTLPVSLLQHPWFSDFIIHGAEMNPPLSFKSDELETAKTCRTTENPRMTPLKFSLWLMDDTWNPAWLFIICTFSIIWFHLHSAHMHFIKQTCSSFSSPWCSS